MRSATQPRRLRAKRRASRAAFTLIELMVAMTAGLLAIGAAYTLSASSSTTFSQQQRLSQTQMSLRMAMAQIRRDVLRAGFGASPNTRQERICGDQTPPGGHFGALSFVDNAGTAALPNANVNRTEADQLTLVGNFATSDEYFGMDAGNNAVRIQTEWQSFRRSFGVPTNTTLFEQVFQPERMLHIRTTGQRHFFATIVSSSGTTGQVTFDPSFNCGGERLTQAIVTPMMFVQYRVVSPDDPSVNIGRLSRTSDAQLGLTNSVLIRQEVAPDGTPIAGTERVVMEYVAGLNFEFVIDQTLAAGAPPSWVVEPTNDVQGTFNDAPTLTSNPHRVRAVRITLSARTAEQVRELPFAPRSADTDPFVRYQVNPAAVGAARVRTMTTEVTIPNTGAAR